PADASRRFGFGGRSGGIWTALRMTELVALRHAAFRQLMTEVDHVVAVCQWVKDLLRQNGVADDKISISRQGLCQTVNANGRHPMPRESSPLRLVFLGRLDSTKGLHVVINALRQARALPVVLDIYGIAQGETGAAYLRQLKEQADGDVRIAFKQPVPAEMAVVTMRYYDVVVVPFQWLETGPLVVLEAFAAGLPVIGSDLGGIAELVTNRVNGLLVEAASEAAWLRALWYLCEDPRLLKSLRDGVPVPRRIQDCARDMVAVYRAVSVRSMYA